MNHVTDKRIYNIPTTMDEIVAMRKLTSRVAGGARGMYLENLYCARRRIENDKELTSFAKDYCKGIDFVAQSSESPVGFDVVQVKGTRGRFNSKERLVKFFEVLDMLVDETRVQEAKDFLMANLMLPEHTADAALEYYHATHSVPNCLVVYADETSDCIYEACEKYGTKIEMHSLKKDVKLIYNFLEKGHEVLDDGVMRVDIHVPEECINSFKSLYEDEEEAEFIAHCIFIQRKVAEAFSKGIRSVSFKFDDFMWNSCYRFHEYLCSDNDKYLTTFERGVDGVYTVQLNAPDECFEEAVEWFKDNSRRNLLAA